MIPLFRKIRQKMANDNKPLKYLRYAIGEIVLVVIGILIAIQINNWNEQEKGKVLEKQLLENLIENLEQNCDQLESRIKSIAYFRKIGNIFISALENNLSYQDSMEEHFHGALMNTSHLKLSSVSYEVIKNTGFEIVRNETLKKEMMKYFEEIQPRFHVELSWGNVDSADREKYIDEHFIQSGRGKKNIYKPFDGNSLMEDNYFVALINKTDMQRSYFSEIMKDHLIQSQRLLKIIKEELKE